MLPFEPQLWGWTLPLHALLEYFAFFIGYRYYVYLRKQQVDPINSLNRLSIILGAAIGALIGSRIMGFLENPVLPSATLEWINLLNVKTIMGGLFGGLLGVELAKKWIGESNSSGDLFTLPLIVGIIIGRIGCFLQGTNEFTYGKATSFFMGMDLGDGVLRHPLALYEIFYLLLLFFFLHYLYKNHPQKPGMLFQYFMLLYFSFRFIIEFLKPNVFFVFGLSSIQWLCVICLIYYFPTLKKLIVHAG